MGETGGCRVWSVREKRRTHFSLWCHFSAWGLRFARDIFCVVNPFSKVLMTTSAQKVKLADFGLAKEERKTATRGVGTPAYMPPEMFEEAAKLNFLAVDTYAVAVIMWQLWFKTAPYRGKGTQAVGFTPYSLSSKPSHPPHFSCRRHHPHPPPNLLPSTRQAHCSFLFPAFAQFCI